MLEPRCMSFPLTLPTPLNPFTHTKHRVSITAGEAGNPRRAVRRAIKQVFWRILIFYVGMMFFIGILLPYNDPHLLASGSRTARSPLTIALANAGIAPAAHLINGLIMISVISAGNRSLYVSSQPMVFMARNRKAPKFVFLHDPP
jgi:amino acid transporter